ncbi:hypothetical protein G7Y89_g12792 [Cudoniella acicularis]|uniref:Uncharacterized protein n=1 Tax=Cudoniella acicularis TaxID=354080 RepID=A0A8H4VWM9_9HELO|nr:hypothetical protein G7Y89_g12792 [Cudoniella acicularis]
MYLLPFLCVNFGLQFIDKLMLSVSSASFQSLITAGFEFTPLQVALLNMPYGVFQAGFGLLAGSRVYKFPNSRLIIMALSQVPPIIGTVFVNQLPQTNSWGQLVGIWLISSFSVGHQINLGLMTSNITGSTKRTISSAKVFVVYCAGQISGPQSFKCKEAPGYRSGVIAMLCGLALYLILAIVLRAVYIAENKKRDKAPERGGECAGF